MNTYWHIAWSDDQGTPRLRYDDNREIRVGETLTVETTKYDLMLCEYGLHACPRLWDCLDYAQGTVICKVTLGDTIIAPANENKVVSNARTVIAMTTAAEGERILREFARWCALQVIHLWDAPDVVRRYLETGDESLRDAARAAAWDAAGAAAWDAAGAAAGAAAWDAARAAARAAAWAAARAAARAAAWDAARVAARAAAGDGFMEKAYATLEEMAEAAFAKQEGI
jgi:hypothetical protein